jgi:nucleoside-diphosphate-sugar epimerase
MSVLVIGGSGYIGSRLVEKLTVQGIPTTIWDLNHSPLSPSNKVEFVQKDFLNIVSSDLTAFDSVVLLAGVSSVSASQRSPELTVRSNIEGLVRLFSVIDNKLLIYASSGSVYDGCGERPAVEGLSLSQPRNIYDLTKQVGDEIAAFYGHRWLGLRFGTVNGVSPSMRTDLVINRMTLTASQRGFVEIANPYAHRAILCIDDLTNFICKVVQQNVGESYSGVLNLASFNASIGEIGSRIARQLNVPIRELPSSNTYDFSMSTTKARSVFGFKPVGTLENLTTSLSTHYGVSG